MVVMVVERVGRLDGVKDVEEGCHSGKSNGFFLFLKD